MRVVKAIGNGIKTFMILFSFIVNLVLVVIVVALLLLIFDIKNNVVTPLITGLHSSFVGLDESTIDWTIPVRDTIPVRLNIPLETDTVVTLTENIPLTVNATIVLPGVGVLNNASVSLSLPQGLPLPVRLSLNVPVDEMLDIALDVRAVIPISETQLHDPIDNLRLTFEPIVRALYNLPGSFGEAITLANQMLSGQPVDLMAASPYSLDPWPGFSRAAGVGYTLSSEVWPAANQPIYTGLVPVGGIPALDSQIRPEIWQAGGPAVWNARAADVMRQQGIDPAYFSGAYSAVIGGSQHTRNVPPVVSAPSTPPIPTPMSATLMQGQPDAGVIYVVPAVTPIAPDTLAPQTESAPGG